VVGYSGNTIRNKTTNVITELKLSNASQYSIYCHNIMNDN